MAGDGERAPLLLHPGPAANTPRAEDLSGNSPPGTARWTDARGPVTPTRRDARHGRPLRGAHRGNHGRDGRRGRRRTLRLIGHPRDEDAVGGTEGGRSRATESGGRRSDTAGRPSHGGWSGKEIGRYHAATAKKKRTTTRRNRRSSSWTRGYRAAVPHRSGDAPPHDVPALPALLVGQPPYTDRLGHHAPGRRIGRHRRPTAGTADPAYLPGRGTRRRWW